MQVINKLFNDRSKSELDVRQSSIKIDKIQQHDQEEAGSSIFSQQPSNTDQAYTQSESTTIQSYLHLKKHTNLKVERNNRIFGIILCIQQLAICILYGTLFNIPERTQRNNQEFDDNIFPFFMILLEMLFMFIGFGMLFAYHKKMVWSSIGFTFFIACLTIQWFFIMNNFVSKFGIYKATSQVRTFQSPILYNRIYLWNGQLNRQTYDQLYKLDFLTFGGTLTQAVKCALANCVAFSAILGKAGLLELLVLSFFGTFAYELNRNIIQTIGIDFGSTYAVFTFGGFMGLGIGLILVIINYRQQHRTTKKNILYNGNSNSASFSLVGLLFVFSLFPILTLDPQNPSEKKLKIDFLKHSVVNSTICIYFALSSAATTSIGISIFLNEKIMIRDMINSTTAGGIAAASASFYFKQPWPAFLLGIISGSVQSILQNTIDKKFGGNFHIFNTYSFTLFGVHGFIGSIFGSICQTVNAPQIQFIHASSLVIAIISALIGIGFGLLIGLFISIFAYHKYQDHFSDQTYWIDIQDEALYDEYTQQILKRIWQDEIKKVVHVPYI